MEQDNFQWSIMVNGRQQQFVVRADNIGDLEQRIAEVEMLIAQRRGNIPAPDEQEAEQEEKPNGHFCTTHNKVMTERFTKDRSKSWFDHRWQEGDTWYLCN